MSFVTSSGRDYVLLSRSVLPPLLIHTSKLNSTEAGCKLVVCTCMYMYVQPIAQSYSFIAHTVLEGELLQEHKERLQKLTDIISFLEN